MAKILRKPHIIFGNAGTTGNFVQFGSTIGAGANATKDIPTIEALSAWANGWQNAVYAANKAPFLEEMNAVFYAHSYQMGYLFQAGIPEWDSATIYFTNSVCQANNGQWFVSLQDNNTGNAPPVSASNAYWLWANPQAVLDGGITVGKIPKASATAPGKLVDSAWSDDGVNVKTTLPIKFADNTTQATAASPVTIQGVVTGSRALGTVFQNTTGKPMFVAVSISSPSGNVNQAYTDSAASPTTIVARAGADSVPRITVQLFFIVLPGNYYKVTGVDLLTTWTEWY